MKLSFLLSLSLLIINIPTYAQNNFWEPSNGPYGDKISGIAINSSNHIFASNFYGNRVYFSSNGGNNWVITNNGLPTSYIKCVIINQDDYVFTGTFEGLYRSTNNGVNWNNVFNESITSIGLDENDFIYACTYDSDILIGSWSNLCRSTDKGITWQVLLYGEIDNRFTDVAITQSGHIFVCTMRGIYRSLNNGSTWTLIDILKPGMLAIQSNGYIYGGTNREGIYRSSDNGENWERINSGLDSTYLKITSVSINENDEIFIGTTDPNINNLFPRDGKNYRSSDNGDTWISINNGLMNCAMHTIEFDSLVNIFGGTAIGIFSSVDNGNNWIQKNNGLRGINFISMCSDRNNNFFGVVERDSAFYISSDNGLNWEIFSNDFPFSRIYSIAINQSDHIFAGILNEGTVNNFGICRSIDNGQNWEVVFQDLSYPILEFGIKNNGSIFAISLDGIFRSTNNGDSWDQVSLENYFSSIDFNQQGYIFAGNLIGGVYRSTDNGDSWIQVNNGLINTNIYSISVNHNGYIFAGSNGDGVFKSTDNGESWHQANTGLSTTSIKSIVVNINGNLYAGTNANGVFWSTNNGENWLELNSGLTGYAVYKLSINPAGYLVASTNLGIFKSLNTTTEVNTNGINPPSEYLLLQNYPNPFNPNTMINYNIPQISFVTIKIYDVLGNEVATLVNEEKPAGSYEVEFDRAGLTSGIYFYQLQAGTFVETKKMVLLR